MRIAISGTANVGKSTIVDDFLKRWPAFKTTTGSYRDKLKKGKHSSNTTIDVQKNILDWLAEEVQKHSPEDNVIFDRCPLDNLVYTLWGVHNGKIPSSFADECIPIVRESMRFIDIVFWVPFDPSIPIINDGTREADEGYIREIDAFFQVMYEDYIKNDEQTFIIFPKNDMPAMIPIHGTREQRLAQIADYVDYSGSVVVTDPTESVLSEAEIAKMEELMKLQTGMVLEDKFKI
jgi:hypothetical protein